MHDRMAQLDALQVAVALAKEHVLVQLPQCLTSLVVLISQPVEATVSQSAKPALHDEIAQTEPLQAGVEFGRLQALAQPPQLLASLVVLTHLVPLQSVGALAWQPDTHVYVPAEPEHTGVPPLHAVGLEVVLQPPQLAGRVMSVSQPFKATPSQSA
jgi:hypothetical protein